MESHHRCTCVRQIYSLISPSTRISGIINAHRNQIGWYTWHRTKDKRITIFCVTSTPYTTSYKLVVPGGVEPPLWVSKTRVLPLYEGTSRWFLIRNLLRMLESNQPMSEYESLAKPICESATKWRRVRDSNSRILADQRFSRPSHSTTLPTLH